MVFSNFNQSRCESRSWRMTCSLVRLGSRCQWDGNFITIVMESLGHLYGSCYINAGDNSKKLKSENNFSSLSCQFWWPKQTVYQWTKLHRTVWFDPEYIRVLRFVICIIISSRTQSFLKKGQPHLCFFPSFN